MDTNLTIVTNQIAGDFAEVMKGKLHQDKIDAAVEKILNPSTGFAATAAYSSVIFYFYVHVNFTGNPPPSLLHFTGNGGGLGLPAGGFSPGTLYTDDVPRLLANTVSFQTNSVVAYFNVNFFDDGSNLLGSFHGAAIGVLGIGGGTGSWSQ